jgi:hypothetical protein
MKKYNIVNFGYGSYKGIHDFVIAKDESSAIFKAKRRR